MIKELKLSNFRLFDDEVTIRFRPITVFVGENNSGKSTAIHFLKMLQKSLWSEGQFFIATESSVSDEEEAAFGVLKNKESNKESLRYSLTMSANASPPSGILDFAKGKCRNVAAESLLYTAAGEVKYNEQGMYQGNAQQVQISRAEENLLSHEEQIKENSSFLRFEDRKQIPGEIERAVDSCAELIRIDLRNIRHISPVREGLKSVFYKNESFRGLDRYVGKDGKYTLHEFFREVWRDKSKMKIFRKHSEKTLGISDVKFDVRQNFVQCNATSAKTGAKVNLAHFGFGVHQCMSFFTQGLIASPHSHVVVEQPEVHVHPTAQIELGSLISDLWNERKVQVTVETHSANLLLRLRRLVSEGLIEPEDISVAFFSVDEGKAAVTNMDFDGDGALDPGLPIDFFDADIMEMFMMKTGDPLE